MSRGSCNHHEDGVDLLRTAAVLSAALALALAPALTALAPAAAARTLRGARRTSTPHRLYVRDSASLHFLSDSASSIYDGGRISGTLPGSAKVRFLYDGSPHVRASFTISAAGGAIYGSATCLLHNPTSPVPSFEGVLHITGGRGRYAHAAGSGHLYGVFHRHGYAIDMQAIGQLSW